MIATAAIQRPLAGEYNEYYHRYIALVPDGDLLDLLQQQGSETVSLLRGLSEEKSRFAYAPGKWTVRDVLGHVVDAERVFGYRALSFARGASTPLPSFDENGWAATANASRRTLEDHIDDFIAVRASTLALLRSMTPAESQRAGIASDNPVSVRALAYIIAGHERHHVNILKERYGV